MTDKYTIDDISHKSGLDIFMDPTCGCTINYYAVVDLMNQAYEEGAKSTHKAIGEISISLGESTRENERLKKEIIDLRLLTSTNAINFTDYLEIKAENEKLKAALSQCNEIIKQWTQV